MKANSATETLHEEKDRLVLRAPLDSSTATVVERAKARGWKSITLEGSLELRRAVWFEARMAGITVVGYQPTNSDDRLLATMEGQARKYQGGEISMSGPDLVADYNNRVLPELRKKYEDLQRERRKLGVTTTDLDRTYGINLPIGRAREVDEQCDRAKGSFARAVDSRNSFLNASKEKIAVKLNFEDGVARLVAKNPGPVHSKNQERQRGLTRE